MAELSASGSFDDGHYNLDCADGLIDYFRDISDVFKENSEYLLSERRPSLDSLKWLVGVMLGYRSALQEKAPLIMQPPPPLKAFLQGQAKLMELWHRAFWSLDELVQLTEELYSLQLQQPMLRDERVKALSRARRAAYVQVQSFTNMHLVRAEALQGR